MFTIILIGERYGVTFEMSVEKSEHSSRGDHYAGDGTYTVRYGSGAVTVRDIQGQCIAACQLRYPDTGQNGHLRAVNDEAFRQCIEVDGLLREQRAAYADWLAERWIERFRSHRGSGMPGFPLEPPDREEFIRNGFVLDASGQASFPLRDA